MQRGITPNFLFIRADTAIPEGILTKISRMTGIELDHVIPAPTIDTIYQVPLDYYEHSVGQHLLDALDLAYTTFDLQSRKTLQTNYHASTTTKTIAMVGKYVDLEDAYFSLNEAIKCAGWMQQVSSKLVFIDAETITSDSSQAIL
jgi:CTP synthase